MKTNNIYMVNVGASMNKEVKHICDYGECDNDCENCPFTQQCYGGGKYDIVELAKAYSKGRNEKQIIKDFLNGK